MTKRTCRRHVLLLLYSPNMDNLNVVGFMIKYRQWGGDFVSHFDHDECVRETLQDLREDAALLHLALMGAQVSIDELTWTCLLRLSDYLDQHVKDICALCGP